MATVKHAVIRTDNMAGTHEGSLLKHVMFYDGSNKAAIDNAQVVEIGALETGEREIFVAKAPAAGASVHNLAIVAGVVLFYDESVRHYEDEWENAAGAATRAYMYHPNTIFSATAEAFSGTPEVGKYVGYTAGSTKLTVQSAFGETTFGVIIDKQIVGRYTYFGIREIEPKTAAVSGS